MVAASIQIAGFGSDNKSLSVSGKKENRF